MTPPPARDVPLPPLDRRPHDQGLVGVTAVAFGQAAHHANTYVPLPELHATDAGRVLPQKLRETRKSLSSSTGARREI